MLKWIGVIGAGVMGVGVAHAQHKVVLIDIRGNIFAQARDQVYPKVCLSPLFNSPPEFDKTPDELISQVTFKTEYQQLHDVDFAVRDVFH